MKDTPELQACLSPVRSTCEIFSGSSPSSSCGSAEKIEQHTLLTDSAISYFNNFQTASQQVLLLSTKVRTCFEMKAGVQERIKTFTGLIVVSEVAYFHVFLQVIMIEILLHPSNITPVEIPLLLPEMTSNPAETRNTKHAMSQELANIFNVGTQ